MTILVQLASALCRPTTLSFQPTPFMETDMRLIALFTLALTTAAMPALAQDRTPPTTDLRAYAPPIDWTPSLRRPYGSDFDSLATNRADVPRRSGSAERH